MFGDIRELYASTQDAKLRGYGAGRFSFNVRGGRCEACQGDGIIKIEMHFLPDVYVPCDVCKGRRYNRETLEIKYKGKSIYDVLEMTVDEGLEFFSSLPRIARKLKTLQDVGLGYIKIGQPATTLSGGEAQRVKLATELSRRSTGRTIYILDRADNRPAHRRRAQADRGAAKAGGRRQHRCRDRAQSGPDQDGGLYHRPGAGGRRRRRRSHRMRDTLR